MSVRTPADHLANVLYLGAGALLVYALLSWVASWPVFSLHRLEVQGSLRHVNEDQVKRVTSRGVRGNFFTVDLDAVREAFEKLPWVATARVTRRWPDLLVVELTEHQPLAHWNGKDLLSDQGIVFNATVDAPLPRLNGMQGTGLVMLEAYRRFGRTLESKGMRIAELTYSPRRAWRIRTDSGLEIALGRTEPDARLERFAALYQKVSEKLGAPPGYADLRYADGFAVRPVRALESGKS